jgi:lysophospholipase L1-like esterase
MRVLVFGASSTQGFWDSQGGWADRLKHHYNHLQMQGFSEERPRIMNLGISGDTTGDILKRIVPESKARENDKGLAIVLSVGSNNAAEMGGHTVSSPDKYQTDLEAIIKKAEEFTYKVLVVGLPAVDESTTCPVAWADMYYYNENIAKFEKTAQAVCERLDVPFVPVHQEFLDKMAGGERVQSHDGLHPNDTGHKLIFDLVRPELDKLLNS